MPLSKKRDKARKRIERALDIVQPNSNLNPVQPTGSIPGLIMEGNKIVGIEAKQVAQVEPGLPIYNPAIHKPGARVLMKTPRGLVGVIVPEIDAEGNAIPGY